MRLDLPTRSIAFPRRPLVMGIVNINDDSFCNDGSLLLEEITAQIQHHIQSGADCIDLGAESARTNRAPISTTLEIQRLSKILAAWDSITQNCSARDAQQVWPPILSVNTWRPEVIAAVLDFPVEIINDMSGLPNPDNAQLCATHHAALLIMHNPGQVKVAATHLTYPNILEELRRFFSEKIHLATHAGLSPNQLILDPGIDFGKQLNDNLSIFAQLDSLISEFPHCWLLPVSRKTMIGEFLDLPNPLDRDPGTIALIECSMSAGAHFLRVHHSEAAWSAIKVLYEIQQVSDQ